MLIYITLFAFLPNYLYLCTYKKRKQYDTATKQAIQYLQGGAGPGVPAGVLHGAWGAARDGAGRDAGGGGRAGAIITLRARQFSSIKKTIQF